MNWNSSVGLVLGRKRGRMFGGEPFLGLFFLSGIGNRKGGRGPSNAEYGGRKPKSPAEKRSGRGLKFSCGLRSNSCEGRNVGLLGGSRLAMVG